jgi:hypothetical protein
MLDALGIFDHVAATRPSLIMDGMAEASGNAQLNKSDVRTFSNAS